MQFAWPYENETLYFDPEYLKSFANVLDSGNQLFRQKFCYIL